MQSCEYPERGPVPYLLGPVISEQVWEPMKPCVDTAPEKG